MSEELDKLLSDLEADSLARKQEEKRLEEVLKVDAATAARLQEERKSKVAEFRLNLDLGEEDTAPDPEHTAEPAAEPVTAESAALAAEESAAKTAEEGTAKPMPSLFGDETEEEQDAAAAQDVPEAPAAGKKKKSRYSKSTFGCIKGILYAALVLGVSGVIAFFAVAGGIDMVGLNKSSKVVSVTIPQGASTEQIADILKEAGLIDQPLVFRLYSKLTKADGQFQAHEQLDLSPDMGYSGIIKQLKQVAQRETVRVTVPEGYTLEKIAKLMEENKVCTASAFFDAAINGDFSGYDFIRELPTKEQNPEIAHRIYDLEGYLFPDTYEFFTGSSATTVIKKMLDNFDYRFNTSVKAAMKARNMTINETVILASIIQGEAANSVDMERVSRVLYNRMQNKSEYPKLECDSTGDYLANLLTPIGTDTTDSDKVLPVQLAYDTYKREGLPVGAINNPGLDAIMAAINPSADQTVAKCYFFATDFSTGITYYSKTYAEHERTCKKYGIGMYG